MSKWKSKFSSLIESLKKPLKKSSHNDESSKKRKVTKKSRPDTNPEHLVDSMEWEDESVDHQEPVPEFDSSEVTQSNFNQDEDEADDLDESHDETNPSFSTLTINQIKQSQIDSGEAPPELPNEIEDEYAKDDDHHFEDENDFEITNPAIREYTPEHKRTLLSKLIAKKPQFNSSLKGNHSQLLLEKLKNINTDEFFEKFYAPQNRKKIHFAFLALLFTGISIKSAQIISTLLTPLPTAAKKVAVPPPSLNEIDTIKNSLAQLENNDLFRAPRKGKAPIKVSPTVKEQAICLDAKKKSDLKIKLLSTVVLQDEVKSLASVQRRKDSEYLRKGDSIPGVLEVGRISSERVFFKNLKTRECEYIESAPKKPEKKSSIALVREPKKAKKIIQDTKKNGITNVGNQFKIKKEVRERMLENISEVLTQARAVQIKNPDGSLAFRMQEVVPGSIYSQLNIENGDVITGINGSKIKNVSELMQLFGRIDKIDHLELSVKKKGIEQDLSYDFE